MNFMNAMKNELNKEKTYTENGAVAYAISGKELLDFSFETTALRDASEPEIENKFMGVYFENPLVAMRYLFWLRDCRGGNGERRIFRVCLKALAKNKPSVAKVVLPLVSEYGRWDDLWCLLDTDLKDNVIRLVLKQLDADISAVYNNQKISLLGKWMPSENTSSAETRRFAKILREGLGISPKSYRKTLSLLRSYGNVVETYVSANNWSEINYSAVPSQANLRYKNAFMRHDMERRNAYLDSLVRGDAKINAGVLQPHEIVAKYNPRSWWGGKVEVNNYDETLEQLWKALPDVSVENAMVVRDGSGSMTCNRYGGAEPLAVASALAIYIAEHNTGVWKDKFITFSHKPKLIDLSNCKTLRDKLVETYAHDECENTNIEATMDLVLQTAIANHCTQDELPARIIIVSDMAFDSATTTYEGWQRNPVDESLFDGIARKFEDAGYLMPKIVFWNVNQGNVKGGIPMQQNKLGVVLMSGYSTQLMTMAMSGETDPYKVLLETISVERYNPVEDAVKDVI